MAQDQEYGGFWARFVALVIDNAVVFVVLLAAGISLGTAVAMAGMEDMTSMIGGVVFTVIPFLYWPVLESSSWQATVGKRVMGLQVTDLEGNRLTFVHALLRAFAKIVSSIPMGIGFLIAAFTARKQALHDIIVKTLVVRTGPSQLWKILLALIVGFIVMAASAAGLFYYVLMPMFQGGLQDAMKGAPEMKTIPAPAPAPKATPAPQAKPAAPAPQAAAPVAAPAPTPAAAPAPAPAATPAAAAVVKPELKAEPKAEPAAAPAKPERKPSTEPRPRAEPKAQPAPVPAPMAAAPPAKPGPKFNDVMSAALSGDAAGVNELLDMGRWVDRRDSAGYTPLMVAVRLRDAQMAQLLMRRGADVNASAAAGVSPLAIARKNRDAAMVELLQKGGAR